MTVPHKELMHLEHREGNVERVYEDSLGNPTCGVGHLLTAEEREQYAVGDKVPKDVRDQWFKQDAETAYLAAYNQANGMKRLELQSMFFHISFQQGASWFTKWPKAWGLLKDGRDIEAAVEFCLDGKGNYPSKWLDQTPLRVADAMHILSGIAKGK